MFNNYDLTKIVSGQEDRVKLSEIESISLSKDKLTAARRSSPIDQVRNSSQIVDLFYFNQNNVCILVIS